jgi:hypothetical protein
LPNRRQCVAAQANSQGHYQNLALTVKPSDWFLPNAETRSGSDSLESGERLCYDSAQ